MTSIHTMSTSSVGKKLGCDCHVTTSCVGSYNYL